MEEYWQSRTELLIGKENLAILQNSHVCIFGLGGVGGYAAEQLCRAGIGKLTIIDSDVVNPSNRNRQIIALKSTEGIAKTKALAERLKDINPNIILHSIYEYLIDEKIENALTNKYDYIIDAIDTLSPKVYLIYHALRLNHRIISSMGAAGKTNPALVEVAEISASHNCRLAYFVRKRLHKLGIYDGLQVIFSPEKVKRNVVKLSDERNKKTIAGTISYMPAIFGCICAAHVIRQLIKLE